MANSERVHDSLNRVQAICFQMEIGQAENCGMMNPKEGVGI